MTPHQDRIDSFLRLGGRLARTDLRYLLESGFWGNLQTLSVTLFSLALYLVCAHLLSKETFGVYQYLLSLGAILGALTLTGMNTAVTSAVARGADGALRAAVTFQLRYLFIPIMAALCGSAYYLFQGNVVLAVGLLIVGIGTPLGNAWNTYSAFLLGKKDFKRIFQYNLAINIPFYTCLIIAAFLTESPLLLIGINVGLQVLGYFVAYQVTLKKFAPSTKSEPGLTRYGTHLSLMGALSTIAAQIDAVLAFHYLGAAGLAVYAFATAIPERLGGFFKFLPGAALPKFALRTEEEVRSSIVRRLLVALPAILLIALLYAIFAPLLFSLLFPTYLAAVPYSQLYGLATAAVLTQILISALQAHERIRSLYAFNIMSPLAQLILQCIGVVLYGLWGLVIGRLLGFLVSFLIALALVLMPYPKVPASEQ